MTREEQIKQIEQDRRDREAAILLLLLALAERGRKHVNKAIRLGADWRAALLAVLLGNPALDLPGGVRLLARAMAEAHLAAVARVGQLVDVETVPAATREELEQHYAERARETLERVYDSLVGSIQSALNGAAVFDSISADVHAAGGAFEVTGWAPDNPYNATTEATGVITAAYAYGMAEALHSEAVAAVLTGLRFINPLDQRTTEICRVRHNVTLPLDSPYWFRAWPPLHVNCRSIVVPLTGSGVKFTENPPEFPLPESGWGNWAGMLSAFTRPAVA